MSEEILQLVHDKGYVSVQQNVHNLRAKKGNLSLIINRVGNSYKIITVGESVTVVRFPQGEADLIKWVDNNL